jgi:hypothetical protein
MYITTLFVEHSGLPNHLLHNAFTSHITKGIYKHMIYTIWV